jgi:GntR family transcriptional regulator
VTDFVPRYYAIEQALRARVAALDPHAPLPSDAQLCEEFGVSRMTARGAMQRLVHDGLVYRVPGRGTFVATHTEEKTSMFRFLRIRRSDGRDEYPASRLIDVRRGKASAEVARLLEIKPAEAVFVVRRVLEYAGEPVVLDDITLPATLFKGLTRARIEAYRGSMYGFFETQCGVRMLRAQERIKAIAADAASAAILKVRTGEPLLAVERLTRTYGDRPVEWRRGLCSTRRHYYLNELG